MAQPILAIDHINGPQVYRMNLADPSGGAIGGPLPISATFTGLWTPSNYHTNWVVRHGYKIYAYQTNRIFMYDENNPSNDWTLIHTFAEGIFGGNQCVSGLHKILIDEVPHLVILAGGSGSNLRLQYYSYNLVTETTRSEGVFAGGVGRYDNQGFHDAQPWKQFLFFFDSDPGESWKFDWSIDAISSVNTDDGIDAFNDAALYAPWNDKLYMIHSGSANRWKLFEYDEGTDLWTSTGVQLPYDYSQNSNTTRGAAWQQGGYLWAMLPTHNLQGGQGFTMWRFESGTTISVTDFTSSVPADVRLISTGGAEPPGWTTGQRWTAVVDQESDPANPVTTLYLHEDGTTTTGQLEAYNWDGATLTSLDTGTAANFVLPKEIDGGGGGFWTPGDIVPEVVLVQATGTSVRVTFKLHGGGVQSLGIWWAFQHDMPITRGTLTNPSSGTITGGGNDILSGITADGVTEYSVEWRAQFDGVSDLDDVNLMIKPD